MKKLFAFMFSLFIALGAFASDSLSDVNLDKDLFNENLIAFQDDIPQSSFGRVNSMITAKIPIKTYVSDPHLGSNYTGIMEWMNHDNFMYYYDDKDNFKKESYLSLISRCFKDNSDIIAEFQKYDPRHEEIYKKLKDMAFNGNIKYDPDHELCNRIKENNIEFVKIKAFRIFYTQKYLEETRDEAFSVTASGLTPLHTQLKDIEDNEWMELMSGINEHDFKEYAELQKELDLQHKNTFEKETPKETQVECTMVKIYSNWLIGSSSCLPIDITKYNGFTTDERKAEALDRYQYGRILFEDPVNMVGEKIIVDGMEIDPSNLFVGKGLILIYVPSENIKDKGKTMIGDKFTKLSWVNLFIPQDSKNKIKEVIKGIYINGQKDEYTNFTINFDNKKRKREIYVSTIFKSFPSGAPVYFLNDKKSTQTFLAGFTVQRGTIFRMFPSDTKEFILNAVSKVDKDNKNNISRKIVTEYDF